MASWRTETVPPKARKMTRCWFRTFPTTASSHRRGIPTCAKNRSYRRRPTTTLPSPTEGWPMVWRTTYMHPRRPILPSCTATIPIQICCSIYRNQSSPSTRVPPALVPNNRRATLRQFRAKKWTMCTIWRSSRWEEKIIVICSEARCTGLIFKPLTISFCRPLRMIYKRRITARLERGEPHSEIINIWPALRRFKKSVALALTRLWWRRTIRKVLQAIILSWASPQTET